VSPVRGSDAVSALGPAAPTAVGVFVDVESAVALGEG